jgi:hypothetical protein
VQLFSIRVATVVFVYCFLLGIFYFLMRAKIQKIYQEQSLGKIAFEFVSLVQFILWVPIGFGFLGLNELYLFLLPMMREIFDFILVLIVDRKSFSPKYRRFIFIHHMNSTITRIILLAVGIFVFKTEIVPFLRVCLLYYCCSMFLVAPGATEKLIFSNSKSMGLPYFKTINFFLARMSHIFVWAMGISIIWYALPLFQAVSFSILTTVLVAMNEYFSISSGLPILRESWLAIRTDVSNVGD